MNRDRLGALAVVALFVAGCAGGPVLANPPAERPTAAQATHAAPSASRSPQDPQPVVLPQDDAPHDRLTEWWYYTGHLADASGGRWGFEFVVFRAERGNFPVSWASHLALTDERGNRFMYAQRTEIGPQVNRALGSVPPKFDFGVVGAPSDSAWRMTGSGGTDQLAAAASASEVAGSGGGVPFGLELQLRARGPVALHDHDGWIDFGPGGGSYYYSRTSMSASGGITVAGKRLDVTGTAWFDHQWGDFIAVGGGWDWFAINLDDGTDLTLSLVRDRDGGYPLVYGTLVSGGRTEHLPRDSFSVDVTSRWRSPTTGVEYPAGWRVTLPSRRLVIDLRPTVADQELDTRPTSGVVYWEGSQRVSASRGGSPLSGEAYVELTGYAP
jgi:predicted secreted hydrolase